ncbi:integrase [Algimonas arctica]|uniref:Integrase n=1 Tax=Algimonas arctica TaxID=1479486 RepID=A0A8J3G3H6_9PROT|nr:site-specific integrase [Algimonas arctica]GHB05769.1 integrase [Algimonas arctica]
MTRRPNPPKVTLGTWNRQKKRFHTVNWWCPETGKKRRLSFRTKREAEAKQEEVLASLAGERYFNANINPSVAEVADHWLDAKRGSVKAQTIKGYQPLLKIIVGPLLQGTPQERAHHALTGEKPSRDTKLLLMLGEHKISALTTAQLRQWHNLVRKEVGAHTANRCMSMLRSIFSMAEEDFGVRVCKTPTNLARRKSKPKKDILTAEEVAQLIDYAETDFDRGIYYVFPFLTGVRISEQLGLLWEDVDLEAGVIHIRRVQERDGTLTDRTKTEAGTREIPISKTLRQFLLQWKLICPRLDGELYRVFPGRGVKRAWPHMSREGGGGPLLYANFRQRYWKPAFSRAGVRYVTHHSARHAFVSNLQAQGVEVGLVAKMTGHSNPMVTLGYYTQATRGGEAAIAKLDAAYRHGSTGA